MLQWVYIFLQCSTYYKVSGACHWIHSVQRGFQILITSASDPAFSSCALQVEYSSWYCILTLLLRPGWGQPCCPRCAAWLGSDSVKVLLSIVFNSAKLPGCCSQYGYGWVHKNTILQCNTPHENIQESLSLQAIDLRIKKPNRFSLPSLSGNVKLLQFFSTIQAKGKHNLFNPNTKV